MIELERDIEGYLRERVKRLHGLCVKLPANLYEGIPDRMVLLPEGRMVFVETKRPKGGRFEKLQPHWHEKLRRLGFKVYVLKTKEEVEVMLNEVHTA